MQLRRGRQKETGRARAGRAAPRDDSRMSESEKRKVEDDSSDDDEPIGKKLKVCAHTRMRPTSLGQLEFHGK